MTKPSVFETIVLAQLAVDFDRVGIMTISELSEQVIGGARSALIRYVLERVRGNQVRAAKVLGINRNTLRRYMQQYGLVGVGKAVGHAWRPAAYQGAEARPAGVGT